MNYEDKDYRTKREELRKLAQDPELGNIIDEMTDRIFHRVQDKQPSLTWHHIKSYLIDGYIAFEKIGNSLKSIDPASLVPSYQNGKHTWMQYPDNRELTRNLDNVLYFAYNPTAYGPISFVESVKRTYEQFLIIENAYVFSKLPHGAGNVCIDDVNYFKQKFQAAARLDNTIRLNKFVRRHAQQLCQEG